MQLCVLLAFLEVQNSRFQQAQELSQHLNLLQKDWTSTADREFPSLNEIVLECCEKIPFVPQLPLWQFRRWSGNWELSGFFWFCRSFGKIGGQIVGTASAFVNSCLPSAWCNTGVTQVEHLGHVGIVGSCFLRHKSRAPSLILCLQGCIQTSVAQNFLLMHTTTYLSFTSTENKDTLCLFEVISKVICVGFVVARAPENPSPVQDTLHNIP